MKARRSAFVKQRNDEHRLQARSSRDGADPQALVPGARSTVNPRVVEHAARFLRDVRNGGWVIFRTPDGDWRLGLKRVSGQQLVEFAKRKGFDPSLTGRG
jgi:hypothetical protein